MHETDDLLTRSSQVALAAMLRGVGEFAGRASQFSGSGDSAGMGLGAITDKLPAWAASVVELDEAGSGESVSDRAAHEHQSAAFIRQILDIAEHLAAGIYGSDTHDRPTTHHCIRLPSLFESLSLDECRYPSTREATHCLPLGCLTPAGIFPGPRADIESSNDTASGQEYAKLWQRFMIALEEIPSSHRESLSLWLDHFDAAWLAFAHAIPHTAMADVSLYDHSKTAAALAVALWRWHVAYNRTDDATLGALRSRADQDELKLLLIQGDFSGIQSFIFAGGAETQRQAARILRGRSFQVSLLSELAALTALEALALPPTSQIVNAAGKFTIVAPNTPQVQAALDGIRRRIDAWCLEQTFGESGFNLAATPASSADFGEGHFGGFINRLFGALDAAKFSRFGLCREDAPRAIQPVSFPLGPCAFDGRRPARRKIDGHPVSPLASDQIEIGKRLADHHFDRLLIIRGGASLRRSAEIRILDLDYFGYAVAFTSNAGQAGHFGEQARSGDLLRCWDFSLPGEDGEQILFKGYARRDINAFVPSVPDEHGEAVPITLDRIADLDKCENSKGIKEGVEALAILKGDVDRLGALFQSGIRPGTFARMVALSRQMNAFFSVHLPWKCRSTFRYVYTVFAGGDDFFLIGPWHTTQVFIRELRDDFTRYVAGNPQITFSAGISIARPGMPIRALADGAESALAKAKDEGRNRVTCHGQAVEWPDFATLAHFEARLEVYRNKLSNGFIHGLLQLAEKAASAKPEDAIWQSWLAYRVRRFVVDRMRDASEAERIAEQADLAGMLRDVISRHKLASRIAIANHLYRHRSSGEKP